MVKFVRPFISLGRDIGFGIVCGVSLIVFFVYVGMRSFYLFFMDFGHLASPFWGGVIFALGSRGVKFRWGGCFSGSVGSLI